MLKAMMDSEPVCLKISDSKKYVRGIIQGMMKEDGSGNNWIVKILTDDDKYVKLFVRGDESSYGGRVVVLKEKVSATY
jgi:hypothetical protein